MSEPEISIVIPFHAEKPQWIERCLASVLTQEKAPSFEIVCVCDAASEDIFWKVSRFLDEHRNEKINWRIIEPDHGDLGLARNTGIAEAKGRYIALLDGDDLFGAEWLRQAYDYARDLRETLPDARKDDFVLHTEYLVMFGAAQFIHRCFGDDAPEFDARDLIQFNLWSALAFAPKTVFQRFPYLPVEGGFGFEDFSFNVATFGAGLLHRCPPGSMHAIRLKHDHTSLAARASDAKQTIPAMTLYDRRDIPKSKAELGAKDLQIPNEVHKQIFWAHHHVGEFQLSVSQDTGVRVYPREKFFDEQAALKDAAAGASHAVLVRRLVPGGAEKYAVDWACAISDAAGREGSVVIIETEPALGPKTKLRERCETAGVRVLRWQENENWNEAEREVALTRALIQMRLSTVFVCNSPLGWGLIHANAQVLANQVFAASFAIIPWGLGFTNCPPFHIKNVAPNFTLVTDNEAHAAKIRKHNPMPVEVIKPRCVYHGQNKRSSAKKERFRVLWAGRGTPEKRPDLLPALAAALEGVADIHVWGDVKPMNGPENLKYRGPFDGFESIDGSYDCYLMTSYSEGMPNTACEAALAGLPIVGPKVGGLPALACRTYETFDPLTVAELVKAACVADSVKADEVKRWAEEFPSRVLELVYP